MNVAKLKSELESNEIPIYYYNINGYGEIDQRICLVFNNENWETFYSERGKKFDVRNFDNESEACYDIMRRFDLMF